MKSADLFSLYFLSAYHLNGTEDLTVEYVDPKNLITKERFDLACKIYYVECREKKQNIELAKKVYAEHIKCITNNKFSEPDSATKRTLDDFFTEFDELIDSIKKNGFNEQKSIVPVGANSSILNGSHRVAICYYFGIKVPIVRIGHYQEKYDYLFFKKHGLNEKYLDFIAMLFTKYLDSIYIGFLWPVVAQEHFFPAAKRLIDNTKSILYKKDIYLNFRGLVQLMMQIYGQQDWTGGFEHEFINILSKAKKCYSKIGKVSIFVICNLKSEQVNTLKDNCRCLFNVDKHSIHITDTQDEAKLASTIVFNKNSLYLLNSGYIFANSYFINSCKPYSFYETLCFSNSVSTYFFRTPYDFKEKALSFEQNDANFLNDWFDSIYCFGKKIPLEQSGFLPIESPYEAIWKKEEQKAKKQRIRRTLLFRFLRRIKKLFSKHLPANIQKSFKKLDALSCKYLVLRNYEKFFNDLLISGHNDVDILVFSPKDRSIFLSVFRAIPRWKTDDGHAYKFFWKNRWIDLDIRIVGDDYYDSNWEKNMIINRVLTKKGFYVMKYEDYKYSLLYHGLYQKKYIPLDYIERFAKMFDGYPSLDKLKQELRVFMDSHNYYYCYPQDDSVICFFDYFCDGRIKK